MTASTIGVPPGFGKPPALVCREMTVVPATPGDWDATTPNELKAALAGHPWKGNVMEFHYNQWATYFFQTREGGMGILQIIGFTDQPPAIKIRYELVTLETNPAETGFTDRTGLEFRLVAHITETDLDAEIFSDPAGKDHAPLRLKRPVPLGTNALQRARILTIPPAKAPRIELELTAEGARRFADLTRANIGRRLAIVFQGGVLAAPILMSEIPGGRAAITGRFSERETADLAWELNRSVMAPPPLNDEHAFTLRWDPNQSIAGQESLFDLDRARSIIWPPETGDWHQGRIGRWIDESGADLLVPGPLPHPRLALFATKLVPVDPSLWTDSPDRATLLDTVLAGSGEHPELAPEALPAMHHDEMHAIRVPEPLPATFAFRTAEGTVGLLQVTGLSDDSSGIQFRYKIARLRK